MSELMRVEGQPTSPRDNIRRKHMPILTPALMVVAAATIAWNISNTSDKIPTTRSIVPIVSPSNNTTPPHIWRPVTENTPLELITSPMDILPHFGDPKNMTSQEHFPITMSETTYDNFPSLTEYFDESNRQIMVEIKTGIPNQVEPKPTRIDFFNGDETTENQPIIGFSFNNKSESIILFNPELDQDQVWETFGRAQNAFNLSESNYIGLEIIDNDGTIHTAYFENPIHQTQNSE